MGANDGFNDGAVEGGLEGVVVGFADGMTLGIAEGTVDGLKVIVGVDVDGTEDGSKVGTLVGMWAQGSTQKRSKHSATVTVMRFKSVFVLIFSKVTCRITTICSRGTIVTRISGNTSAFI